MNSKFSYISFFNFSIILLLILINTNVLFAQKEGGNNISLHVNEESPLAVFRIIESQYDYHFIYDENLIDSLNKKVTINCEDLSLRSVLNSIKKQTQLKFKVYDKSIAVAKEKKQITISGIVTDSITGEYLKGAVIIMLGNNVGATTNENGYYSLNIPAESVILKSRFLGYAPNKQEVDAKDDLFLDFKMKPQKTMLHEVLVSTTSFQDTINENVNGVNIISVKDIGTLPLTYSEPDFVKSTYYLPGVSRLNYGSTGYSVRGSSGGENIVYLDNCPLYNISHRLADLSVFNPNAIQNVSLYKAGIPAEYGGGASVLNVTSRNGDENHFHLKGGVSLISTRLSVEGPISKGKLSYLISLRRSNMEWKQFYDDNIKKYRFFDVNSKLHYKINAKQQLNLSCFYAEDLTRYYYDSLVYKNPEQSWATLAWSLSWNYRCNPKLSVNTSVYLSVYNYDLYIYNNYNEISDNDIYGTIFDYGLSHKYSWLINKKNAVDIGCKFLIHDFFSGDDLAVSDTDEEEEMQLTEAIAFYDDKWKISNRLNVNYGLRFSCNYSMHNSILGCDLYDFIDNRDYMEQEWEPRIALSYKKSKQDIIKMSFNQTYQNIHQVSYLGYYNNSYFICIPSSSINKPLISRQLSLGVYHNTQVSAFSFSAETYFRVSKNNISYFTDSLTSNTALSLQNQLVSSIGKTYGLELYGHMNKGKVSGNISYTLSRSIRQSEEVNNGEWYSSNYDRPHNLAININYYFAPKFRFVLSGLYSRGMPSSVSYENLKNDNLEYDNNHINKYRLPDYHRLDLGLVFENKKYKHRFHSIWSLNLYNVYNRNNKYINEGVSQFSSSSYNNTTMFKDYGIMPAISYSFQF